MEIMRAGKNWKSSEIKEQNHSGLVVGACIAISVIMLLCATICRADCSGLSPELQKAHDQLVKEGFNVSCRSNL